MGIFSFNAFLHPKETFASAKANASLGTGLVNYVVAGVIAGILGVIASFLLASVLSALLPPEALGLAGAFGMVAAVTTFFTALIGAVVGALIINALYWIVAKILGGSGGYTTQFYLTSLYAVPVAIIVGILSIIPLIGSLIAFLVSLYALYLLTLALGETHGFSLLKAVLCWLIPVIILSVLVVAGLAMFIGSLGSLGGYPISGMPF